jgi:hypothetical protein
MKKLILFIWTIIALSPIFILGYMFGLHLMK